MGVTGTTLEARQNANWAIDLSPSDARKAATYATLDLNGFPFWLKDLASAKPDETRSVLMEEIRFELDNNKPSERCDELEDISRTNEKIIELLAHELFQELKNRRSLLSQALGPLLKIIRSGLRDDRDEFFTISLSRFETEKDHNIAAHYLAAAINVNPDRALAALENRIVEIKSQRANGAGAKIS